MEESGPFPNTATEIPHPEILPGTAASWVSPGDLRHPCIRVRSWAGAADLARSAMGGKEVRRRERRE